MAPENRQNEVMQLYLENFRNQKQNATKVDITKGTSLVRFLAKQKGYL
jgi:hypothetical protein